MLMNEWFCGIKLPPSMGSEVNQIEAIFIFGLNNRGNYWNVSEFSYVEKQVKKLVSFKLIFLKEILDHENEKLSQLKLPKFHFTFQGDHHRMSRGIWITQWLMSHLSIVRMVLP